MATRHVWYGLSAILMVASIVMLFTRGLNLAIDFTGGVSAQASFPATVDLGAVRSQLATAGFRDPQVQNFGSSRNIAIRLPPEPKVSGRSSMTAWRALCERSTRAPRYNSFPWSVRRWAASSSVAPHGRSGSRCS